MKALLLGDLSPTVVTNPLFADCEAHTDVWRELFPTANQTNEK